MTRSTSLVQTLGMLLVLQLASAAKDSSEDSASAPAGASTWTLLKQAFGLALVCLLGALYLSPKYREKWITYNGLIGALAWYAFRKVKARITGVQVPESKRK